MPAPNLATLRPCRSDRHRGVRRRAEAPFERSDALLAAASVPSLPHVSAQAAHRRKWGRLSDAVAAGHLDVAALRTLLARPWHLTSIRSPPST